MSLETYIPEVRRPVIGGKAVSVAPLKVRQIPAFARAVSPAAAALFAGDIAGAIGRHGESLIEAISIATGEPVEWLGDLEALDFMRLVADVVEVNADFFGRRMAPELSALVKRMTTAITGATPSPSSSPAVSDGETATT